MEQMERGRGKTPVPLAAAGLPKAEGQVRWDVYETVTRRILERMENGVVPWQSPSIARTGFPRNFATQKSYRGINVFLLGLHEFQSPYFLTFLQAKDLGGTVRKGETGFPIVKVGTWSRERESDAAAVGLAPHSVESRKFLKLYTVFNACQIDGVVFPEVPPCATFAESELADNARHIVAAMPRPPLIHEGRKSYPHYVPDTDTVEMPSRETFRAEWRFYKTLFHELAHATGHQERLNRPSLVDNRGSSAVGEARKIYCLEELVAEMTAAFLGAHAGIIEDGFENSAAYLQGWLSVLQAKDNKTWLVKAASDAQRAADYILGQSQEIRGERWPAPAPGAPTEGPLNTPP